MRLFLLASALLFTSAVAATGFRGAPAGAAQKKSPLPNQDKAAQTGAKLFAKNCASCHGPEGAGSGNIPSLAKGAAQVAAPGELSWFLERGAPESGMPKPQLSVRERWQVIAFVNTLPTAKASNRIPVPEAAKEGETPLPSPPFSDYRTQSPGRSHHLMVGDLPKPFATDSAGNSPSIVPRPKDAWPKAPEGFTVQLYAEGFDNPRAMRLAPNGDVFLVESDPGRIRVLRGLTPEGKATTVETFATGLNRPYGLAFFPAGPNPEWLYVGNTDSVVRIPYRNGDLHARGAPERLAALPSGHGGHWTRDLVFSADGKKLFVAVGSASNVDDPDESPREKNRADILVMTPEGKEPHVFASGIRNAGGGLAIQPGTGELWCSVNERDALGDNLVPDYITRVKEGGFYGWPWWYLGAHQDPRHKGKHPELASKAIAPDVLLQPHNASLQLAFYQGKQFPREYRGDLFAAQHGSWNRSTRTGYEVIRVLFHGRKYATGAYEDFLTGFVVDPAHVWGRPVGVAVAADGSLLVSDDGSGSVWRIYH